MRDWKRQITLKKREKEHQRSNIDDTIINYLAKTLQDDDPKTLPILVKSGSLTGSDADEDNERVAGYWKVLKARLREDEKIPFSLIGDTLTLQNSP